MPLTRASHSICFNIKQSQPRHLLCERIHIFFVAIFAYTHCYHYYNYLVSFKPVQDTIALGNGPYTVITGQFIAQRFTLLFRVIYQCINFSADLFPYPGILYGCKLPQSRLCQLNCPSHRKPNSRFASSQSTSSPLRIASTLSRKVVINSLSCRISIVSSNESIVSSNERYESYGKIDMTGLP